MRVNILGTGSRGNCYLLTDKADKVFILDCGVKTEIVKQALDFNIRKIVGCFVSHSHG